MKLFTIILFMIVIFMVTACDKKDSINESIIAEPKSDNDFIECNLIDGFIDIGELDYYELSLYTTDGVFQIINLDREHIDSMMKGIVVSSEVPASDVEKPTGGTTGGRVFIKDENGTTKYDFQIDGKILIYEGKEYTLEGVQDLAIFFLDFRILLNDYRMNGIGYENSKHGDIYDYEEVLNFIDDDDN